jgi:hypothetical protein
MTNESLTTKKTSWDNWDESPEARAKTAGQGLLRIISCSPATILGRKGRFPAAGQNPRKC